MDFDYKEINRLSITLVDHVLTCLYLPLQVVTVSAVLLLTCMVLAKLSSIPGNNTWTSVVDPLIGSCLELKREAAKDLLFEDDIEVWYNK
jgi:hypothetical protein